MIRFLLPLFCLFPLLIAAQAKDTIQPVNRFQLGVVAGYMQHEIDFTPSVNGMAFPGNNFGVGLRYFDNHLVGFQAELSFSNAGWREELDPSFSSLYERKTSYAELLILSQLSVGKGAIQPMLQAGPYVSLPLSESISVPTEYNSPETALPQPYLLDLPFRVNYGVQIGAGLNIELGPLTIQADGRYLLGFSDLIKTGTTTVSTSRRKGLGGHLGVFYAVGK